MFYCCLSLFDKDQSLNVTGNSVSSRAIKVYWNPVSPDVQGYSVRYWTEKEGDETAVEKNVSKATNSLLIDNLKPFTVYAVQVTALGTHHGIRGRANISTYEGGMLSRYSAF